MLILSRYHSYHDHNFIFPGRSLQQSTNFFFVVVYILLYLVESLELVLVVSTRRWFKPPDISLDAAVMMDQSQQLAGNFDIGRALSHSSIPSRVGSSNTNILLVAQTFVDSPNNSSDVDKCLGKQENVWGGNKCFGQIRVSQL